MRVLELRHAGFAQNLRRTHGPTGARLQEADAPGIYWTAVALAGAIYLDKDSEKAGGTVSGRCSAGALDSVLMNWEAGRPGGDDVQAEVQRHFERAVRRMAIWPTCIRG
jgi:hypothetical protein